MVEYKKKERKHNITWALCFSRKAKNNMRVRKLGVCGQIEIERIHDWCVCVPCRNIIYSQISVHILQR